MRFGSPLKEKITGSEFEKAYKHEINKEKWSDNMETPENYTTKLDYDKTFKIEILNEFANGVYSRLLSFVLNNGMDRQDKNNPYNVLLDQFVEMLDINLFKMSFEELEVLEGYWKHMNKYIREITK
ncbi:hypothetical protein [Bacillus badius]|nr:hypothetical protein [Bacillus badius]MED4717204.1 hypothetical protein [Bacillus badius]